MTRKGKKGTRTNAKQQMLAELNDSVEEKESLRLELASMKRQLAEVNEENQALQQEMAEIQGKLDCQLEHDAARSQRNCELFKEAQDELHRRQELETELREAEKTIQQLQEEVKRLNVNLRAESSVVGELVNKLIIQERSGSPDEAESSLEDEVENVPKSGSKFDIHQFIPESIEETKLRCSACGTEMNADLMVICMTCGDVDDLENLENLQAVKLCVGCQMFGKHDASHKTAQLRKLLVEHRLKEWSTKLAPVFNGEHHRKVDTKLLQCGSRLQNVFKSLNSYKDAAITNPLLITERSLNTFKYAIAAVDRLCSEILSDGDLQVVQELFTAVDDLFSTEEIRRAQEE